jgi:hypothetical protein
MQRRGCMHAMKIALRDEPRACDDPGEGWGAHVALARSYRHLVGLGLVQEMLRNCDEGDKRERCERERVHPFVQLSVPRLSVKRLRRAYLGSRLFGRDEGLED